MRTLTDHHDGHGLNDVIEIDADEQDPDAGGASHRYRFWMPCEGTVDPTQKQVANVQFQHGPRNEEGSVPGVTEAAILVMLIDRLQGFQTGPYPCEENEKVLEGLQMALEGTRERVENRAKRGVLGTNTK